jgi:hypothetical protein
VVHPDATAPRPRRADARRNVDALVVAVLADGLRRGAPRRPSPLTSAARPRQRDLGSATSAARAVKIILA